MDKPRRLLKTGPHATEATSTRFQGELMTCALCGREERSDPAQVSQWRYLSADGIGHYVCPRHFPLDTATAAEFRDAYVAVLTRLFGPQGGEGIEGGR